MARDLKNRSWDESEEIDFQSDEEINLFGGPEYEVYLRYEYIEHSDINTEKAQDKEQD